MIVAVVSIDAMVGRCAEREKVVPASSANVQNPKVVVRYSEAPQLDPEITLICA